MAAIKVRNLSLKRLGCGISLIRPATILSLSEIFPVSDK
jgi:hypothetical protein